MPSHSPRTGCIDKGDTRSRTRRQDRQSLASALHDLRKASGLSGDRLARRCGMSQSKVSRIETGRLLPSVVDVEQLLTALEVDEETWYELLALARTANAEYQDVRASVRRGLHHRQRELATLEANTTPMRHFLPSLVTGLLQIPEYMRAAMSPPVGPAAGDVGKAIVLKLERQAVLYDKAKNFEFLLTESAVRWQLCEPSIMAVQIDRLVSLSRQPNIRIGVLPLSMRVSDGSFHTFVTYDRRLVTIELFTGRLVLRDPKDIDYYCALFDFFSVHALWAEQARTVLRALADAFRSSKYFQTAHRTGPWPCSPIRSLHEHGRDPHCRRLSKTLLEQEDMREDDYTLESCCQRP
jgi:transcriptional regulator with XRE-family HTH domain